MTIIMILLILAALYAGGMWAWCAVQSFLILRTYRNGGMPANIVAWLDKIVRPLHKLGLCFILAVGFLGLLLK